MSTQTLFRDLLPRWLHCWKISMFNIFVFTKSSDCVPTLEHLKVADFHLLKTKYEPLLKGPHEDMKEGPQVEIWILYVISKWSMYDFDIFLFFLSVFRQFCLSLPNDSGWIDNTEVKAYLTPAKLLKDPLRGFGATALPASTNKEQARVLCSCKRTPCGAYGVQTMRF